MKKPSNYHSGHTFPFWGLLFVSYVGHKKKHGSCPPAHLGPFGPQVGGFPTTFQNKSDLPQPPVRQTDMDHFWDPWTSPSRGPSWPLPSGKGAHFHLGLTSAFLARNEKSETGETHRKTVKLKWVILWETDGK